MSKLYERGLSGNLIETNFTVAQFDRLLRDRDGLLVALDEIGVILTNFDHDHIDRITRATKKILNVLYKRQHHVDAARSRMPATSTPQVQSYSEDGARKVLEEHLRWLEGEGNRQAEAEALKVVLYRNDINHGQQKKSNG